MNTDAGKLNARADATAKTVDSLSCCPKCQGELQATVEVYMSKRDGEWTVTGVNDMGPRSTSLTCYNDCDLSEYEVALFEPIFALESILPIDIAPSLD